MVASAGSCPLLLHHHLVVVVDPSYRGAFPLLLLVRYHILIGSGSDHMLPLIERVGCLQDPEHATLGSFLTKGLVPVVECRRLVGLHIPVNGVICQGGVISGCFGPFCAPGLTLFALGPLVF